ncbi:lyase family protein [Zafaria sp. Z1313]|uniref:lyase family protein n=1 Tax=unclassified Zafaria TaxID=2828765 RepID=UPI002E790969|nr:lyase family protein [Zafaria sp. J156]MEE1621574.1 lyase family protein [Zafaria sp. J156]
MMTSTDYGLLNPAWAGTAVAAATDDAALVQALLDVEAAWVAVLEDAGLCPAGTADAVDAAADASLYDAASLAARTADGGNVLIPLLGDLRAELKAAGAPGAAAVVHRGATSQDIIDTALMLLAVRAGGVLRADVRRSADALARLADAHRGTLCVARSLTQHALPGTFGLRAANWLSGVVEAGRRLESALDAAPLQWGGAVGTLASLTDSLASAGYDAGARVPELTGALAAQLGLADPGAPWHTNRLPLTGLGASLADVCAAAGKVAADVLLLARPELAELTEPREAGKGGSSAMPQKQNPVLSVLIKQAALAAPQHAAQLFLAAGTAVDERPDGAWHAEWAALRELLRLAGGSAAKLASLAEGLGVHPEAMARNAALSGDLLVSERLMARLAPALGKGDAAAGKARIQAAVRDSLGGGGELRELLRAGLPDGAMDPADFDALFHPSGYLGQADAFIDAALARHRHLRKES